VDAARDTLTAIDITMTMDDDHSEEAAGDDPLGALFRELAEGRIEALDGVWRVCADQLYGLALWRTRSVADAEDAVQEVFVRLARRGTKLSRVRDPRAYLLRMARNAAVDIASRRRHEPLDESIPPLIEIDAVESRVDARRASALVGDLPVGQREVIFLKEFAGLTFRQVAEVCGVPLFTAASRHRLAIKRLRQRMGVER
jgi:RNA polymerase sigma-70 factor (ECF subfamily)